MRTLPAATVLSINSQLGMIGDFGAGMGLGALGDRFGTRVPLALIALLQAPLLALFARRRGDVSDAPADAASGSEV